MNAQTRKGHSMSTETIVAEMRAAATDIYEGGIDPSTVASSLRDWAGRLAAQEPTQGRKPIETAPRDGTVIRLSFGNDFDTLGWWMKRKVYRGGRCYSWAFIDTRGEAFINHAVANEYGPTHWAPYEPAAQRQEQEGGQ